MQVKVHQLGYSLCGTSTSTDYWPNSNGIFVDLLEKVQLLCSGHTVRLKGKVVSGGVVYYASGMHVLYKIVYSHSQGCCWVAIYFSVDGVV